MIKSDEKSDDEDSTHEPGERWDPLGADDDDVQKDVAARISTFESFNDQFSGGPNDTNRIKSLEEEQEVLTTSLMALTSHFAQVQLRLRQIVDAPAAHRDLLLKSLEEFAFRGIPELSSGLSLLESDEAVVSLERSRSRQFELIDRLKKQLTELEKFAYESGAPVLPQSILFEKHKIIIDELKNKFNFNVSDFDLPLLSPEDIKTQVDTAIGEFVGPLKMKDQLVAQLKTQITDLERFIAFLQNSNPQAVVDDASNPPSVGGKDFPAYNSYSAKKKYIQTAKSGNGEDIAASTSDSGSNRNSIEAIPDDLNPTGIYSSKTQSLLRKASTLMQIFALTQFGCGSSSDGKDLRKNPLKRSNRSNHWGDIRAQLEVDIQEVAALAIALKHDQEKQLENMPLEYETYQSDSDDDADRFACERKSKPGVRCQDFSLTKVELTTVVRKNLAVTLQKLMQHGLRSSNAFPGSSLVPFIGCLHLSPDSDRRTQVRNVDFSTGRIPSSGQMHAWELILQYYYIKNGENYNETPSRKLSQSFNLDIVGNSAPISNKQSLLSVIGTIIEMHKPYKRSNNSHFKAFVCAALNAKKLVVWLNLIFQCTELIKTFYISSSYVAKTGFRDALHSLDILSKYDFDLPIDLAVRHFQNIKDVFM